MIRKAAKTIGGRALFLSDNAPALIMSKLRDQNATGIIADIYSGGFHMLKKVLASSGYLFKEFVDDMIDPLRLTAAFKTYYAMGSDPRQRWTEEPQIAVGHTAAMVHGYQQHLNAQALERDDGVAAKKVDVNNPGEWKKVHQYVKDLVEEHGRISLVPMLFWLRCCDIASMLRSCGKALPSGDFELYRKLIRLCRILFALTNSMKYIRVNFDFQIFLETCNRIDFLIAKEIGFTGRTATNKPQFMDELQEKLVQIIRILSGGGAGGKRMSPMVASHMRPRVRNAEEVLHQMRTVLHELGLEEDASTAADDCDALVETFLSEQATEQYNGQFLDDENEKLDNKMIDEDKWRNKPLGVMTICAIQWAVQHGLYHPNPLMFVDNNGKVIPPNTFVSLTTGNNMSMDMLAAPIIGVDRLTKYCRDHFGEWIPEEEQRKRKSKRPRRTIDKHTNAAIPVVQDRRMHGPALKFGRFLGPPVREGDTKEFNSLPFQETETNAIDQVYSQRKTTTDVCAILNKKTIGNTGMRLFQNKGKMIEEINRVIEDYGTDEDAETNHVECIQRCVLSHLDAGATQIPLDTTISRKDLAQMIVSLRMKTRNVTTGVLEDGVPCSEFLENDGRPTQVEMTQSNSLYYSTLDRKVTKRFKPLEQDFLKNTLCSCSDNECTCEAVVSPVQLRPETQEDVNDDSSDGSSDENEEHVVVVANASRVGIQAVIDRIRTQRNVVHVH